MSITDQREIPSSGPDEVVKKRPCLRAGAQKHVRKFPWSQQSARGWRI